MSNDKFHDQKVYAAGWKAGHDKLSKDTNPYRGRCREDEGLWDRGWERGNSGKDFDGWE